MHSPSNNQSNIALRLIQSMTPAERLAFGNAYLEKKAQLSAKALNTEELFKPAPACEWIQKYFYIPELNGPIVLHPHQVAALNEALAKDGDIYRYTTVVWSDIKKSAKSTVAGAVALWVAFQTPNAMIRIVANDLKQADSRVAAAIRKSITLNPAMRSICKVSVSGYSITLPNGSVIEAVPVDPKGEAGGNDDFICFSELWGAKLEASKQMWAECTTSPTKFGHAIRWVETYAGFSGESPLLEPLYEDTVRRGQRIHADYEMYRNARTFAMWNTVPRLPWQTPAYYAEEARTLLPTQFQRLHRNQWVSSEQSFVDILWWDACGADMDNIREDDELVGALDAAVSGDTFALLLVAERNGRPAPVYVRKWIPPSGGQLDYGPIEQLVREVSQKYNVVEWAYDPYQLHDFATRLRNDGVAVFYEFKQGEPRLQADKALWDRIRDRRIINSGDGDLREHIQNANSKLEGENKMRIVKRADNLKIDLAVALSMACFEGQRLGLYE